MNISQLKIYFTTSLKDEYPPEEISSFFNLLSQEYMNISRLDTALNPDIQVNREKVKIIEAAVIRLKNHEPIQYIIGKTEFFGLKLLVNENVLIPRPETEELVQWVLQETDPSAGVKILDIGTGSGCIAISLAKNLPGASVSAVDISEEAINTAKINAEMNDVEITFLFEDILEMEDLPQKFDIIISNPPYVRELEKEEMQRNVLEHEPPLALYVKDRDPLLFYRKITKLAEEGLAKSGYLFFEINQYLGLETGEILKRSGFKTELRADFLGNDRMIKGIKL